MGNAMRAHNKLQPLTWREAHEYFTVCGLSLCEEGVMLCVHRALTPCMIIYFFLFFEFPLC